MPLIRINRNPSSRELITFAGAWLVVVGLAGAQAWRRGHPSAAEALGALAAVVPLAGCVNRGMLKAIFVGLSYATFPLGFVVSHVVLALVYFLVLTPIGLLMRLFGYDPLTQRTDRKATTYWIRRVDARPVERYFRQS